MKYARTIVNSQLSQAKALDFCNKFVGILNHESYESYELTTIDSMLIFNFRRTQIREYCRHRLLKSERVLPSKKRIPQTNYYFL